MRTEARPSPVFPLADAARVVPGPARLSFGYPSGVPAPDLRCTRITRYRDRPGAAWPGAKLDPRGRSGAEDPSERLRPEGSAALPGRRTARIWRSPAARLPVAFTLCNHDWRPAPETPEPVHAENFICGCDQQSCPPCRGSEGDSDRRERRGTIRLWNLNVDQAIDRICVTTSADLTPTSPPSKRARYIPQSPYNPPCRH